MNFKMRKGRKVFISNALLDLFPDRKVKFADFVTSVRRENYPNLSPEEGRKQAYRRICSDFKGGVCHRKWGKKNGYQLVKLDGDDGWVYFGWVSEEEIRDISI